MRFSKQVAILAIIALAVTANAQNEGTLRTIDESQATQGVVIMNSNSNSNTAAAVAPVQQPTTIVEAQPVQESRAELMRKARQNAEVSTEQKIVEKLEESRLREEQQPRRAERLRQVQAIQLENAERDHDERQHEGNGCRQLALPKKSGPSPRKSRRLQSARSKPNKKKTNSNVASSFPVSLEPPTTKLPT